MGDLSRYHRQRPSQEALVTESSVVLPPVQGATMTTYQPATPFIIRPTCSRCGTRMMLARIEPDAPGHDRRSFECSKCGNEHSEVVVFK